MSAQVLPAAVQWLGDQSFGILGGAVVGFLTARHQEEWKQRAERRRRLKFARRMVRHRLDSARGVAVAGLETRVHVVEGNGELLLEPANIRVRLRPAPVELPPLVETLRARVLQRMTTAPDTPGVAPAWNSGQLVSLLDYRISRTGAHEEPQLHLSVSPVDYATFTATVTELDEQVEVPGPDGTTRVTSVRQEYFPDDEAVARAVDRPVTGLANGLGIALLVFTDDEQVILSRRRSTATARPGERDVSVVEGMHTEHDLGSAQTLDVVRAATRGCREELGINVSDRDVKILALGVDMTYHQWSFLGLVDAPFTADQILDQHGLHAQDRWEGRLEAVPADPRAVFERFRQDGIWDLGLVTAYLALCHHGDPDDVQRAAVEVYGEQRRRSPLPQRRVRSGAATNGAG